MLDISGGSVRPDGREQAPLLARGDTLSDCRLMLPDEGLLVTSLCVRNMFDVTTRSGTHYVRVGCEYVRRALGAAGRGAALYHAHGTRTKGSFERVGLIRASYRTNCPIASGSRIRFSEVEQFDASAAGKRSSEVRRTCTADLDRFPATTPENHLNYLFID